MERIFNNAITVETTIQAPVAQVWECYTTPEHIIRWNAASDDWHTSSAENDLREGGKFSYRMEAKDGSMGFDFWGIYDRVLPMEIIEYTMGDGRKAKVLFSGTEAGTESITRVITTFEMEQENSAELQQAGWQAILDNFRKHVESTR